MGRSGMYFGGKQKENDQWEDIEVGRRIILM
jgi:hypothetical protein